MKFYEKLKKYEESLAEESQRIEEAIKNTEKEIIESIDNHLALEGRKEEYEAFFKSKLEKYGVSSPAELSEEEKKKFFNEIDSEYTKELDESIRRSIEEAYIAPQSKSDDEREGSEPAEDLLSGDDERLEPQTSVDQEVIDGYDATKDEVGEGAHEDEVEEGAHEDEVEEGMHEPKEEGYHSKDENIEGEKEIDPIKKSDATKDNQDDPVLKSEEVDHEETPIPEEIEEAMGVLLKRGAHEDEIEEMMGRLLKRGAHDDVEEGMHKDKIKEMMGRLLKRGAHDDVEEGMHEPKEEGYHKKEGAHDDVEEGMHEPKEEGYHKKEGAHEDEISEEEAYQDHPKADGDEERSVEVKPNETEETPATEELEKPEEHDLNDVEVSDLKTGEIIRKVASK